MVNYVYDGSFEGLMTAIYESYSKHEAPEKIMDNKNVQESLFDTNVIINTDEIKARQMVSQIKEHISPVIVRNIFYAFLSEQENIGTMIYDYINLAVIRGDRVYEHLSDDRVLNIYNTVRRVLGERHRMLGLIRFKKLKDDIYYSSIEPDYNISLLLAPHFVKRLSSQNWIIHDLKRKTAALYNKKEWIITAFEFNDTPILEEEERDYQTLWKQYFNSIAIQSKINPGLQKKNMPVRYWKYLIEMLPDL